MNRQFGVFLFGAAPMAGTGAGPPDPTDRRTTNAVAWDTYERMIDMGVVAEQQGFDYYFATEHHFQREGYEVVPNSLLLGLVLAERTSSIKIGALVHVLPQWHPLRFAEDFATLHNFSGGRAVMGIGRGTVPREAMPLGAIVGSTDDAEQRAAQDAANRRHFDEAIEVVMEALGNERFSHHGERFDLPPPGVADRGGVAADLTLVPRPLAPFEVWQTVTSPPTLEAVARRGFGGVWWNIHPQFLATQWETFAATWEVSHGRPLEPGAERMLVVQVRVEDTHEEAVARARPAHDEFWKFLAPYGRARGYRMPDGSPATPDFLPALEDSMEQRIAVVGTPDHVTEVLAARMAELQARNLTLFPICLGDHYDVYARQIQRYGEEILPGLR